MPSAIAHALSRTQSFFLSLHMGPKYLCVIQLGVHCVLISAYYVTYIVHNEEHLGPYLRFP